MYKYYVVENVQQIDIFKKNNRTKKMKKNIFKKFLKKRII